MKILISCIRYLLWAIIIFSVTALLHNDPLVNQPVADPHAKEIYTLYLYILIAGVCLQALFAKKNKWFFLKIPAQLILASSIGYASVHLDTVVLSNPDIRFYIGMALIGAALVSAAMTTLSKIIQWIKRIIFLKNKPQSKKDKPLTEQDWQQHYRTNIKKINEFFDAKQGSLSFSLKYPEKGVKKKDKIWTTRKMIAYVQCEYDRSLASMTHKEREALRVLRLMELSNAFNTKLMTHLKAQLIWADKKADINSCRYLLGTAIYEKSHGEAIEYCLNNLTYFHNYESAFSYLLKIFNEIYQYNPNNPCLQEIDRRIHGGNAWLDASQFDGTGFASQPSNRGGLLLGKTPDRTDCWFTGEGSLITVAPPGAGKTQTHVIPNLLSWKGPAIVLDVKGELWDKTAAYRASLGPVYRFSPLDPDHSHRFNPLCYIRNDPDYLWEDSKYLADLIVVRSDAKDPFWENRAQDLITAAIAVECLNTAPEQRDMATVVGYCYGRDWTDMLAKLELSPVNAMRNAAEGWINATGSSEKTLDSIRQQAQTFMSAWEGSRVERATKTSDWHPLELREKPVTLYIALKAGEIDAYASLLRVFVGVHIRTLIQTLPPQGAQDILLMLDELPRLKYMPAIEEAVELGRQYKLKLFMIIQSIGQLKKHYKNSDGLIGSCAVRAYMNPSASDGTAEKLTKEFGQIESIVDGSRRNLAEINDLTGPDYKDAVLVLSSGTKPLKLSKSFAYQNQTLQKWMESNPPTIQKGKVVETPASDSQNKSISTKGVY